MATSGGQFPAFEGPHGTIHGIVGANGHMSPVSFSGFDPALLVFILTVAETY